MKAVRARIGAFHFHHFRHNFIAWGESLGIPERLVSGVVGHATQGTITRKYAGIQQHPLRKASQDTADAIVEAMTGKDGG
jgi:integrase